MHALFMMAALTVGQVSVDKNDFKVVGASPAPVAQAVATKEDFPQVVGGIELKPIPAEPVRQAPKQEQPVRALAPQAVQEQVVVPAPRVIRYYTVPPTQYVPQQYYLQSPCPGGVCPPRG